MATPVPTEHSSTIADNAQPVPARMEDMDLDVQVNGLATEHNAVDALPLPHAATTDKPVAPSTDLHNADGLNGETSQEVSIAPISGITSGIAPTAPFLEDPSTTLKPLISGDVENGMGDSTAGISAGDSGMIVNGVSTAVEQPVVNGSLPEDLQDTTIPTVSSQMTSVNAPQSADEEMVDAPPVLLKVAREREDDEDEEPSAKRARTEDRTTAGEDVNGAILTPAIPSIRASPSGVDSSPGANLDASITTSPPSAPVAAPATTSVITPASVGTSAPVENGVTHANSQSSVNFGPMSDAQTRLCLEGLKSIRKSRNAAAFQKPVDHVALKIPTYPDIVKHPMDLGTMEQKLKAHQYSSVNDYISDFDLMVSNSVAFNGPAHLVTQNASSIRATLNAQLKKLPRPGQQVEVEQPKKTRKASVTIPRDPKPRASRPIAVPTQPPAVATEESFALDADGMPQIRRHSSMTDGRPKREIHKPPPKDLPYSAKPKKKKYQQELKFCQEVLDEITRPAYANSLASAFMQPVDPVALNIPNYRSIIKKPMDFATVREKLQTGNYENGKEFESDVKLIFANCYKFNGKDHFISKMAIELEAIFDQQMQRKSDWLSKHAPPPSAPQSPEIDSDVEEEEEEEEEDEDAIERQAQLSAIHAQFEQLSRQLLAVQNQPPKRAKSVSKKAAKPAKAVTGQARRKSGTVSGGASLPIRSDKKTKVKTKALKPVTTAQKEEISEKIGQLTAEQMGRAAEIIKTALRKAGRSDLADRGDDEMEFEIDQIPDEALHELLKLVRKWVPTTATTKSEDHDYRPAAGHSKHGTAANQGKARKNKPMKGSEQDLQINRIKAQLNAFQDGGADGLKDEGDEAVSSGDDSDSGSESEEE